MFNNLIQAKAVGTNKMPLKKGDTIHLKIRSDGGKGWALVLGRITVGENKYASKVAPLMVTLKITDKEGKTTTSSYMVKDSDSTHLGQVDKAELDATLSKVDKCVLKSIETKAEYDARIAKKNRPGRNYKRLLTKMSL